MIETANPLLAACFPSAAPVTMAHLARELGVSKNTVSLALRHDPQISPVTRDRVQAAARRLGYTTNPVVAHLMAELRKSRNREPQHTLALINASRSRDAFRSDETLPTYVAGCRRRAASLRYGVDSFWLHDPELDGVRLGRILRARGIQGVIVIGTMDDNHLPDRFADIWANHPCVVTGVRTHGPTLPFCCVDHHALVLQAMEQALALGYRRPGLVIPERVDRLLEGRLSAGMLGCGQQLVPAREQVRHFYEESLATTGSMRFYGWLEREKPDVILTLDHDVRRLVEDHGLRVPDDIGLIQLDRRGGDEDWAGMDQHNDLAGEAAVEMVVGMLHKSESGLPPTSKATFIEASWVSGRTVRAELAAVAGK